MKVKIVVEETLTYIDEIIIIQPETMSDEELEQIIKRVEKQCREASDVAYVLESRYGLKVVERTDNFPESPDRSEIEITDIEEVE
ncbi:hypothetical protein [Desulfitobacterium chlororespirans]|uniref:Uncharacterized protein n=1 Tax=Desulfitobacterium chlororespirans DSM 11544 TaxID=1121395 RepID=A0A1M7U3F5_9FIRM|nr:hypothetical protein [Desulfitobacterium chlororespirans]SHN77571.1 hypothetical protein SAMN02745215_02905 [Desulfitobacterium chlororespirans DSM 11544]